MNDGMIFAQLEDEIVYVRYWDETGVYGMLETVYSLCIENGGEK